MELDLSGYPVPGTYYCGGKKCYLDPIREKFIEITPEETVRQQLIHYLLTELAVPKRMIRSEIHLSHYGVSSRRRADVVIHACDDDGILRPVALIECKAPGVLLGETAAEQMFLYCDEIGCDYCMMSNGHDCFSYRYDNDKDLYVQISKLPVYSDLLADKYETFEPGEMPDRIQWNRIPQFLKENLSPDFYDISMQTDFDLACAAFNLLEGLLDPRHQLPLLHNSMFSVKKDLGVIMKSFGNASGGIFSGPYRSFLIDHNGQNQVISFGFSTYQTYNRPDLIKTSLNIGVESVSVSHHSLQLIFDDNVICNADAVHFYHHGKIAVGNIGSGKTSGLRELVEKRKPDFIFDKRFYFGAIQNNRNWNLDDPEVAALLENLMIYALIRDEYRNQVKIER